MKQLSERTIALRMRRLRETCHFLGQEAQFMSGRCTEVPKLVAEIAASEDLGGSLLARRIGREMAEQFRNLAHHLNYTIAELARWSAQLQSSEYRTDGGSHPDATDRL